MGTAEVGLLIFFRTKNSKLSCTKKSMVGSMKTSMTYVTDHTKNTRLLMDIKSRSCFLKYGYMSSVSISSLFTLKSFSYWYDHTLEGDPKGKNLRADV